MSKATKNIPCAVCVYARQDVKASAYTQKRCGKCEIRKDCEICRDCEKRNGCLARINPKCKQSCERRLDAVCSGQQLVWAAIQCTNPKSEYHRALLNITLNGDIQSRVTWNGCACGETRRSGSGRRGV
jgi:hypothetical protein